MLIKFSDVTCHDHAAKLIIKSLIQKESTESKEYNRRNGTCLQRNVPRTNKE